MTRRSSEDWARLWEGFPYKELGVDASVEDLDARDDNDSEPYALIVALLAAIFILETFVATAFTKTPPPPRKTKSPRRNVDVYYEFIYCVSCVKRLYSR